MLTKFFEWVGTKTEISTPVYQDTWRDAPYKSTNFYWFKSAAMQQYEDNLRSSRISRGKMYVSGGIAGLAGFAGYQNQQSENAIPINTNGNYTIK